MTDELTEGDRIVIKGRPVTGHGEIDVIKRDGSLRLLMDDGRYEHMPAAAVMREPEE